MAEMRFRENVTEVQDKTEDGKEAGISYNYDEYLLVMLNSKKQRSKLRSYEISEINCFPTQTGRRRMMRR
jgi:hypothetical protein